MTGGRQVPRQSSVSETSDQLAAGASQTMVQLARPSRERTDHPSLLYRWKPLYQSHLVQTVGANSYRQTEARPKVRGDDQRPISRDLEQLRNIACAAFYGAACPMNLRCIVVAV